MPERDDYERGVPCWADLATSDPDAARQFYAKVFGWEWQGERTDMGPMYYQARLGGRRVVGLSERPPEMARAGADAMWNTNLATDDCDATTKAVEAAGGAVMMPPMDVMGYGRMSFVADSTGAPFGVWEARSHHGSEVVNEPGSVIWNELLTTDPAAAADFYHDVFGLVAQAMPMGDQQYTVLFCGDRGIGGIVDPQTEGLQPHWQVTFAVADCDGAVQQVTALGGTVVSPPADLPTVGRFAVVADPQRAGFGVLAAESASP